MITERRPGGPAVRGKTPWRPGTLDAYVALELIGPFLFGVAAFTGIMTASSVLFELISLMVHFGIPMSTVLEVLALKLPEMAFYTFPMSVLLATLLAFGRLSGDSEITAMRAQGLSLFRIVVPVLVLATFVSGLTIALDEYVVPNASWQAKNVLYYAQHHERLPTRRDNVFYDEMENGQLARSFYARHFDGQRMEGVVVQEFEGDRLVRIIQAKDAYWAGNGWEFTHGTLYQVGRGGDFRYVLHFDRQIVRLKPSLMTLSTDDREPMEMNLHDLAQHIALLRQAGHSGGEINDLLVQWQQKLSIPFASLVFALVGAPLGLRNNRSSNSLGLGLSILILFVYYLGMFVFTAMGQTGALPSVLAAWMPNILAGGLGLGFLWKAAMS